MSYTPRRFPAQKMLPENLEPRRLFAAVLPSIYETFLVELINRARSNPTAEAARYSLSSLNEGVPAEDTISTTAKQPLAINPYLTDAARDHSQYMVDTDNFSHDEGANDPGDRMTLAGYSFTGSWTWGENIAQNGTTGTLNPISATSQAHSDLFKDVGYAGRGHRVNIMNNAFREIGAGVATGGFNGYNSALVTEDFARTGTAIYLCGVAYTDNITNDNFYTPGEGLGGVTITAKRNSDNATFSMQTWASGGYSLALPTGTYTVTASGGALGGTVTNTGVSIGTQNIHQNFTPDNLDAFATISAGKLTVQGTTGVDAIKVDYDGSAYTISRNQTSTTLAGAGVTSIDVYAQDGDDLVQLTANLPHGVYVDAGAGNDMILGSFNPDTITAGAGKDKVYGNLGNDRLNGNGGHDKLYGEAGKDRLYGGLGNDTMEGGSSTDRFYDEGGTNFAFGQGGDDYFYLRNSVVDVLYGQAGIDHAQVDGGDALEGVEDLLA